MSYLNDQANLKPVFRFRARMTARPQPKRLESHYEDDFDEPNEDVVKVFLRLKPTNADESNIEVLDSKTVLLKLPPELVQCRANLNIRDQYKYTFTNVFRPEVTQSEIFTGCVADLVKELFSGHHCLLFTYGTTNAGKTYTVLGTGEEPGIIPRSLSTVFKSIRGKEYGSAEIMPHQFNSALTVTSSTLEYEHNFKQTILTWNLDKTQSETNRLTKSQESGKSSVDDIVGESVFKEMQRRLTNDTSIVEYESEPTARFSVWISFAEIYNEAVYDLLQPVIPGGKRIQLKLAQDNKRNTYIKGLKHIFVQSEEEAYKVLRFGKNNLQVAATGMNSCSSRSHCIFTIKLVKCPNTENPTQVTVSSFSICDLAGSERQKKTLNAGIRLKESGNINCSLLSLSRCFSIIRENQMVTDPKLQKRIPFRDSKLTQLFQHALMGKESVTMIVNINSERYLWEETENVLKASAIAKNIIVTRRPKKQNPRQSLFSQVVGKHNRSTLIRWDSCVRPKAPDSQMLEVSIASLESEAPTEREDKYVSLLKLVETLREKLKEEKAKHLQTKKASKINEDQIREEMQQKLQEMIKEAKEKNEQDIKKTQEIQESLRKRAEQVIDAQYLSKKKLKTGEGDDIEEATLFQKLQELQEELKIQERQINGLTDLVNVQREEKKELTIELTKTKLYLGWKDKEIKTLNEKIEILGETGDAQAAYLALEKEMNYKLSIRDKLLEEARTDLLEEWAAREDNEKEIAKLQSENTDKEEDIFALETIGEQMKEEITAKTNLIENLENQIDELQTKLSNEVDSLIHSHEEEKKKMTQEFEQRLSEEIAALEDKHNAEISAFKEKIKELEKDLKQQAEETAKLCSLQKEKTEEIHKAKSSIEKLNVQVIKLSQELECKEKEIKAYQYSVPALQSECDQQRKELLEYIKRHEDQLATIINMEQERSSFQANQKEIVGKYEEQLKRTKEENDNLKKEIGRLTSTFIKSTPTPKKELEKQIEELQKQLEESHKKCNRLEEDQAAFTKVTFAEEEADKENKICRGDESSSEKDIRRLRNRSNLCFPGTDEVCHKSRHHSVGDDERTQSKRILVGPKCKSTSKIRSQRATVAPNITISNSRNSETEELLINPGLPESNLTEQPKTGVRKKLYDTSSINNTTIAFEDNKDDLNIPQDSPGTYFKRNLRNRKK